MREVILASGAVLKINAAPFADAKALYKAVMAEAKTISVSTGQELGELYKNLFCTGAASPEIERCLVPCLLRCTYNAGQGDLKIDSQTFEPVEAREDYVSVCIEVAKENVLPFMKSLYAEYKHALAAIEKRQQ